MIRFPCQNCKRKYVLPDALAGLPLLCKGCGGRLTVPGAGETVTLPRAVVREPKPVREPEGDDPESAFAGPGAEVVDLFPPEGGDEAGEPQDDEPESDEQPGADAGDEAEPEEVEEDEPLPDDDDEPPIHLPDDPPVKAKPERVGAGAAPPKVSPPDPSPVPPPLPEGKRALGLTVDVAVGLALAVGGALLGEFAVRKSSVAILREAGSAPKFPPTDLLVWLACVAFPLLVLVLFAKRGKTVGNWLRRRAG